MRTRKKFSHGKFFAASAAALLIAAGLSAAQAQQSQADHNHAEHAGHGDANAPTQWADPGKAQAGAAAESKTEESKGDSGHAGHHPGGGQGGMMGGMMGMDHGAGGGQGMGGMSGMMGGMDHGGGQGADEKGGKSHGGMGMGGGMMGGMMGMGHGAGGDQGAGGMGGMRKHMVCGFADHLDGRLAYLKAELKLTDSQNGAWSVFADAWRAAAQNAKRKCDAMDDRSDHSKPAVLHKLSMMENHMTDHLEIVRAQKGAIESLFTTLSDEQKKIASETLTSVMKVGMSGMSMGGKSAGGMGGMMGGMQH